MTEHESVRELEFVTRGACANTPILRANLNAALEALGLPAVYQVVDIDRLRASDVRRGYPTPTVLVRKHDLFGGMPEPVPPFPEPA
jgi:hypothetical protein